MLPFLSICYSFLLLKIHTRTLVEASQAFPPKGLSTESFANLEHKNSSFKGAKRLAKRNPLTESLCDDFDVSITDPHTNEEIVLIDYLWAGAWCKDFQTLYSFCELDLSEEEEARVGEIIVDREYQCLPDEICVQFYDEVEEMRDAECMLLQEFLSWYTRQTQEQLCSKNLIAQAERMESHFAPAAPLEMHLTFKAFNPVTKMPVKVKQLYFEIEEPGKRPRTTGYVNYRSTANLVYHLVSRHVVIRACAVMSAIRPGVYPYLGFMGAVHVGKFMPHKRHLHRHNEIGSTPEVHDHKSSNRAPGNKSLSATQLDNSTLVIP